MRLHRLRLRDFRGVKEREIDFETSGVTIVEGPNEAGKTSLVDAFDILLEYPDSSRHARVSSAQPRGLDVGPGVEAEFTSGPYHVVYRKRWLRSPVTELRILSPVVESLSGREAHDRVRAIIDETMDRNLYDALRVMQNRPIELSGLKESSSLSTALDTAAGGSQNSDADDRRSAALYDRVEDELHQYFTPGRGAAKGEFKAMDDEVVVLKAAVEELGRKLAAVESDVERHRQLTDEIAGIEAAKVDQAAALADLEGRERSLRAARSALEAASSKVAERRGIALAADTAFEKRQELRDAVDWHTARIEDLEERASAVASALADAEGLAAGAEQHWKHADSAAKRASDAAKAAVTKVNWLRDRADLDRLVEQRRRVDNAQRTIEETGALLASVKIDAELLEKIEHATTALATARAEFNVAAPVLVAQQLGDVPILIGGELISGDYHAAITEPVVVEIPGVARFELRPGTGERDLRTAVERATRTLNELCADAEVADLSSARAAFAKRGEAADRQKRARGTIADLLGARTASDLAEQIARLTARVAAHGGEGDEDLDAARAAADRVEGEAAEAQAEAALADTERQRLHEKASSLRVEDGALGGQISQLRRELVSAGRSLAAARAEATDEVLAEAQAAASRDVEAADAAHREALRAYEAGDPDGLELLLANARAAVARQARDLEQRSHEVATINGQLRAADRDGLQEHYDGASAELDALTRRQADLHARATAAKLLHQVLSAHRDSAKRAYVAPFKAKLESYARLVFGPDLNVEIDDELRIARRTLAGHTDPYDQLSTGAREQLALCARLACAALVSSGGGVPVVIDDALGSSDPRRLERLGAVLAAAGSDAQIIVLTCVPDRYRAVGTAVTRSIA